MNPLSIIITFLLLWMVLAMGIIMVVVSLRRLRANWVTSPSSLSSTDYSLRKRWVLPLSVLLLTLGLFLAFCGVFGTYNLVWAA